VKGSASKIKQPARVFYFGSAGSESCRLSLRGAELKLGRKFT
jgi:hypothetical protein